MTSPTLLVYTHAPYHRRYVVNSVLRQLREALSPVVGFSIRRILEPTPRLPLKPASPLALLLTCNHAGVLSPALIRNGAAIVDVPSVDTLVDVIVAMMDSGMYTRYLDLKILPHPLLSLAAEWHFALQRYKDTVRAARAEANIVRLTLLLEDGVCMARDMDVHVRRLRRALGELGDPRACALLQESADRLHLAALDLEWQLSRFDKDVEERWQGHFSLTVV
jgi:hypothetical protein